VLENVKLQDNTECIDGKSEASNCIPGTPKAETCDGLDNDCNGVIDNGASASCTANGGGICEAGSCIYPNVYWTSDSAGNNKITHPPIINAEIGNKYYLVLGDAPDISNIPNEAWKFEIYEDDTIGDDDIRIGDNALIGSIQGNKVIAVWTINQNDIDASGEWPDGSPFKYYFKVTHGQIPPGPIKHIKTGRVVSGLPIDKGPTEGPTLDIFQSGNLELEFLGDEGPTPTCSDGLQNQGEDGIDCGGPCEPCTIDCTQYVSCSQLTTEALCNECQIAPGCEWNATTSKCLAYEVFVDDEGNPIGKCSKDEESNDDCSDGFLTSSWTATWTWDPANTQQNDPNNKALECIDGEDTIACPSQIQLPLTSWFGVAATIMVIMGAYVIFSKKKRGKYNGR